MDEDEEINQAECALEFVCVQICTAVNTKTAISTHINQTCIKFIHSGSP